MPEVTAPTATNQYVRQGWMVTTLDCQKRMLKRLMLLMLLLIGIWKFLVLLDLVPQVLSSLPLAMQTMVIVGTTSKTAL